jgi:PAS domain S-box-containing protein
MGELTSSGERFKALVSATSDVVFAMSADWKVLQELNGGGLFKDTSGPTTDWRETNLHPDDVALVNSAIEKAIASKRILELEHRVIRPDGRLAWVFSRAVPIFDEKDQIVEWFGAVSDITSRKATEQELLQLQRVYQSVTSTTPDLIYVFELDYTFSYANRALLEMWGKSWDDAVGKGLLENGYEPWHAEMHMREIDSIVATGKQVRGEVSFPHAMLGERVYDYILNPVFGEGGKVIAVSGITRDVTERRNELLEKLQLAEEFATLNEEATATNEELAASNEELVTSQEMLRESTSRLSQILNMLPASVVVIRGEELIVEMINDSNLQYWNKSREEVIGRPFPEILPDLANQPFAAQLRSVMKTGVGINVKESPVIFTSADGSVRTTFVDYSYQQLQDSSGRGNGVLVMSFEITERVLARQLLEKYAHELAKSEARFKFLIQEAPVAIGVLHGRELIVETANGKLLEVWGKDLSVIGQPLPQALPEIKDQPFQAILENVFDSGEAFFASEIRAMLEHDGEIKEFFFNLVYQPVAGTGGEVADILVVAVDVTQQVIARRVVEQSEEHFRRLADLVPAKISNALPSGEVTFFNKHWLDFAGMNFEDLRDFGYHAMMHPEEVDAFESGLALAAASGVPYVSEMRFKNTIGNYIWHLNISSPILDEAGNIVMWVGSSTDINALKEEEQRKSDFVSMLSHELKTPVTSIKGHVQLLLRLLRKEEQTELSGKLSSSLSRIDVLLIQLTGLIGDMLDLSRIDAGRMDLKMETFAIDKLVTEVVEDFRLSHQQHYFKLSTVAGLIINADRDRISQVLINLIANAIKYSPTSDIVDVSVSKVEDEVLISVRDYGIGIAEIDRKRIFERFFRVEGHNEKFYSGFGIGLFLAQNIVARHRGKITLDSEMGKGSVFVVHLPVNKNI